MGDLVFLPGPALTEDEYDSDGSDVSTGSCCCSDCHDPCEGFGSKASRWVFGCGGKTTRCCYRGEGNCPKEMHCYEEWHECKKGRGKCDGRCRRGCGSRECRHACVQVNNTICYDCVRDNACHQQVTPCKCQKKARKRTWWGGKPVWKITKPRRRRKRVIEYDYAYGQADRRCTCEGHSDSENGSEEEERRPRVVRRARKATKKDKTQELWKTKKRYVRSRTGRKFNPQPVETEGDESDNSLRCQVSYDDVETECEEESPAQELKETLKNAVGWSKTLSKEDSEELGERVKESNTSREFCKQSRHSV